MNALILQNLLAFFHPHFSINAPVLYHTSPNMPNMKLCGMKCPNGYELQQAFALTVYPNSSWIKKNAQISAFIWQCLCKLWIMTATELTRVSQQNTQDLTPRDGWGYLSPILSHLSPWDSWPMASSCNTPTLFPMHSSHSCQPGDACGQPL